MQGWGERPWSGSQTEEGPSKGCIRYLRKLECAGSSMGTMGDTKSWGNSGIYTCCRDGVKELRTLGQECHGSTAGVWDMRSLGYVGSK